MDLKLSQKAGHAEVDGVFDVGGQVDGLAVFERNFETATSRAVAADGGGGGVGNEVGRNLSESELARVTKEFGGVGAAARVELGVLFDEVA